VSALDPTGRQSSLLHSAEKQANEDGDDGEGDQDFDYREAVVSGFQLGVMHERRPGEGPAPRLPWCLAYLHRTRPTDHVIDV